MVIPEPIRVLTFIESRTVTGPSRVLIDFAHAARHADSGLPAVAVTLVTYRRGAGESALAAAATSAGVPVVAIPERKRWDWRVIPELRRVVIEFKPDILESRNVKSHFLIRATGLHRQFPWVAWNHGYTSIDWLDRAYNRLDRWSLRGAFRVMTVCGPFAEALQRNGVRKNKISILHNFAKPNVKPSREEVLRLRQQLGLADEQVIITIGRMSAEKGHADLLNALAVMEQVPNLPNYRLVLVGDGPEEETLRRQASKLGITERIVMPGFQRNVAPYYAMATIFALPSHSEGSPNVVLEAMSAGLPIVATTVGGVPEILEHEKTALLVTPRNPELMATALVQVLGSEELRRRLGSSAETEVQAAYTLDAYKRRLASFYIETLQMAGRREK